MGRIRTGLVWGKLEPYSLLSFDIGFHQLDRHTRGRLDQELTGRRNSGRTVESHGPANLLPSDITHA